MTIKLAKVSKQSTSRRGGLLSFFAPSASSKVQDRVALQCRNILESDVESRNVPFDLKDMNGQWQLAADGTPLVQLVKLDGPQSEIGVGNASLSETAVQYAYPFMTLAGQVMAGQHWIGLGTFMGLQLAWAAGTLPLMGRNWRQGMLPMVRFTVGLTMLQAAASYFLGSLASSFVAAASMLMVARPFIEQFLVNVDGSSRPMPTDTPFHAPNTERELAARRQQNDFARKDQTPVMVLGFSAGVMKAMGDRRAADQGMPVGVTQNELSQHIMIFGASGKGKTYGFLTPLLKQFVTLGRVVVRNGAKVFVNGGGALLLCGKGVLGRDLVSALRKDGLDRTLNIHLISPDEGDSRVAVLKGLTASQVQSAFYKLYASSADSDFFVGAGAERLGTSVQLLEAAVELEKLKLEARAVAKGFPNYQAWREAIDDEVRSRVRSTGESFGFEDLDHFNGYLVAQRQPQRYEEALRRFKWNVTMLHDATVMWYDDPVFLLGVAGAAAAGITLPSSANAPKFDEGFKRWIMQHPDVLNGTPRGQVIVDSIHAAVKALEDDGKTRGNIRATVQQWLKPLMSDPVLRGWCDIEDGPYVDELLRTTGAVRTDDKWMQSPVADVSDCLHGAVIGVSLPRTIAGETFTHLIKSRVYGDLNERTSDWRDRDPTATSVMVMIDEAHLVMKGSQNVEPDEIKMASIGRSLGLVLAEATQSRDTLDAKFGANATDGMLANFAHIISFDSTPSTLGYMNNRIGKAPIYKYNINLWNGYVGSIASDFQRHRDSARQDVHDAGTMALLHRRYRYEASKPAGVLSVLSNDVEQGTEDVRGTVFRSSISLLETFTTGLVTSFGEVFAGTKGLVGASFRAASRVAHGKSRDLNAYKVPALREISGQKGENGETSAGHTVELFPAEKWHEVANHAFHAVAFITRGKSPRREIIEGLGAIGRVELDRIASRQPGVVSLYTFQEGTMGNSEEARLRVEIAGLHSEIAARKKAGKKAL
ncbi:hypothetical protein OVY01_11770 [Robbsia sp. Bb-Pol-6]|uniref:TraD/TraG TraM recognition site domain-containing protein n=1 Tax=Robbsia betulipollinis TaxID=2981849 RepID=A0ABT3ZNL4_9BURK|nr:hypothetical protein [Robbsia betulipollinis]MCY0387902.1 hypothetical protein [Robbsia betulipollinis]